MLPISIKQHREYNRVTRDLKEKLEKLSDKLFYAPQTACYYGSESDMHVVLDLSTFMLTAQELFKTNPEAAQTAVTTLDNNVLQRRKSVVRHQLYLLRKEFGLVAPK